MFEKTGHLEVPLDLIVASTYAQGSITLQDFVDLTSQLPRETPLYALVFDDDGVEYSRQIVSAAIRVERIRDSLPAMCIELKVQVGC